MDPIAIFQLTALATWLTLSISGVAVEHKSKKTIEKYLDKKLVVGPDASFVAKGIGFIINFVLIKPFIGALSFKKEFGLNYSKIYAESLIETNLITNLTKEDHQKLHSFIVDIEKKLTKF